MTVRLHFITLILIFCILISGCDINLAKTTEKTDSDVYNLIDRTWNDDSADKSSYRIDESLKDADTSDIFIQFSSTGTLTLSQAVAVASSYNRTYSTEREILYLTALNQIDIQHLYEPIPFSGGSTGLRQDGKYKGMGYFTHSGFQQLLATGAQLGTSVQLGWFDIISGDMRSGFSTVATAVITQPLLRGAGRKIALENLTQAQQNTLYQVRSFNRYRKNFITSVISNYYTVLQRQQEYLNAIENHENLVQVYDNLQKRAKAGRVSKHEYEQADQDILEARSNEIQARKEYNDALDAFKVQLAISPDVEFSLDLNELNALKQSISHRIELSEEQAIEIALNQRLDLVNAADQVIDARRKVDVAADAIRAELNLLGYASTQSSNKTAFGADPGELEQTRNIYDLSLQLDLPIDRLAEKNAYRRALIALMQQQRAHQEMTDMVIFEVRAAYRKMQEMRSRYEIEKQSVSVAEKRSNNALLLLQYNRANTRDVLDAYEDLLDGKNSATETLVDYTLASLEFLRDTGIMKIQADGTLEKQLPPAVAMRSHH